ncbi:hypothetical protein ACIBK8_02250 [Streptomyces sp. NPDC050161]|uniref:hypothetical protein n=1 Tax=Streptomyces sp. NPDC050161 TaxID=3365604 RepID=UPI0037AEA7AB
MSSKTSVDPGELRAAAHAEDAISDDMTDKNRKALSSTKDAAASLKGWSLAQALLATADSWQPSLNGMHKRAKTGATNLRTCAEGHDWNDTATSADFENTDGLTQSAPQTLAAPAGGGIGGPGAVGSEGTSPLPAPPAFLDRGNTTRPARDPGAQWTADDMRNAEPMPMPTADSPFG